MIPLFHEIGVCLALNYKLLEGKVDEEFLETNIRERRQNNDSRL